MQARGRTSWTLAILLLSLLSGIVVPSGLAGDELSRYIVGFNDQTTVASGDAFETGTVRRVDPGLHFAVVETTDPNFPHQASQRSDVRYVEPDATVVALDFQPDDPKYPSMYGLSQVKAGTAWDRTLGSTDVVLCTIDTGVRYTHEDLTGRYGGGH